MADRYLKYLSIKSIIIINVAFLLDKVSALSHNCSTTVWASDATTIAGFNSALLNTPTGIAVGKNDSIYVMDSTDSSSRLQLFYPGSQSGITIIDASYGSDLDEFFYVTAINIDVSGNIYILDRANSRVTKWIPGASTGILVAGGKGHGISLNQLYFPWDFFVEPNTSYIWIADYYNCRVVKWVNTSTAIRVAGENTHGLQANQLYLPMGLFVDTSDSNTLYIADTYNHRIQKWLYGASSGTTVAGQSGVSGSAFNQLYTPFDLIVDTNGSMFIVDDGNNRIVLWLLGATSGRVIAGTGVGGVLPSQLNQPYYLALDSTGALIINDYGNSRIQRFPIICSPNMTTLSRTSTTTISQNTTMAIRLTTNSLTTSASE
ncbi:unnamed protein product [Adineta steineri]|uniref:NHL repeat containing protein-like protein n=1 Tax=Adineta steineri TaxID=433720 RepID=A0A816CX29_9BILA|nr:unnamed protein product [Adineta steineri]CAF1628835.1 unnamed protein product [Adineta steineri]